MAIKAFIPANVTRAVEIGKKRGYFSRDTDNVKDWKHSFVGCFLSKYPNRVHVLDVMTQTLGHAPQWSDITDRNLLDVRNALTSKMAPSSARVSCAYIKAVINENLYAAKQNKEELELLDWSKSLQVKNSTSQAVYLTQDELKKLHRYIPRNAVEEHVKRIFMIEALTGARHVDAERMAIDQADPVTNQLTYIAQKTSTPVTVPVHKWLRKYLSLNTKPVSLAKFNETIRSLCYRAGIRANVTLFRQGFEQRGGKWAFVSSHTGRRSFATNLYLFGTDVTIIAKLMGHSDPQMTWRKYICAEREIDKHTLKFFK